LLLPVILRYVKDCVTAIERGKAPLISDLHAVPYTWNSLCLENHQGILQSEKTGSSSETPVRGFSDGSGSNIVVLYLSLYYHSWSNYCKGEHVDCLHNQVLPVKQTLIQDNYADSQDNTCIHRSETVQSSFEEHKVELYHLTWPAQSSVSFIIEQIFSLLEIGLRNGLPSPTYLKQLEDVLQDE
jgi:hypothetical protein